MAEMYPGVLKKSARNLVKEARKQRVAQVLHRDAEIAQVLEQLDSGRSVLVTGDVGVGKSAVIHGVAAAMAQRKEGKLWALSTSDVLSGTRYIGEWQTKMDEIIRGAMRSKGHLVITDIWNLPTVGATVQDPSAMLDGMRPRLENGDLCLLAEASDEVLRQMQRVPGFVELFQRVAVAPLDDDQVDSVLAALAEDLEVPIDTTGRRTLVGVTRRFLPSRPQPGPALGLLQQVADYRQQKESVGEPEEATPAFVEKVFSIYSGLPRFVVSASETLPASEIRSWFQERLVGQQEAIEAVVETIALYKSGLHDPQRPIGTLLFVGPTGVGKTELAKALATFLFGSSQRMLRFDLSEFKDYHAFEMLVGDPDKPHQPARLLDPVRAQPFQVVLFDELEKAHANIWDLFLQLLDEGHVSPPRGQAVNFRNTLVIATTNVGADAFAAGLGFGSKTTPTQGIDRVVRKKLEEVFRPEFLNRFQHISVFFPLSEDQVRTIARAELGRILGREGISERNLLVDVDDEALDLVIATGYDPRWGARGLKREIQRRLVLPLAMALMERSIDSGSLLQLAVRGGQVRVRVLETAESREHRREQQPVRLPEGDKAPRTEVITRATGLVDRVERLAKEVGEETLEARRGKILKLRQSPDFWQGSGESAGLLLELESITSCLDRIDRLRYRSAELSTRLQGADLRRDVEKAGERLVHLEAEADAAWRELAYLGAEGAEDALLEIRPVGDNGRMARDLLFETYDRWLQARGLQRDWLYHPLSDEEPIVLAVRGPWAFGYLRAEAGLHRVRRQEIHAAARVRVSSWTEEHREPKVSVHRALKLSGQHGEKVRSRLECEGGLILQNERTLAANRELASEIVGSWENIGSERSDVVRRYDLSPFRVRDLGLGWTTEHPAALEAERFHDVLCRRVDQLQE